MIYPARNRVGQTSAPGVVTTTTETLVGERSALTKQRRGLEAALTRAAEDAERLRQGQRAAADRGNLPDSPHEVRRRALIAAAEVRHATVLDELQRLDARLAQIPGELEALRTPELELERDRQARSRLELSAVELRVAVDIKRLEASLTELASLSKRRQRRSEALILLGRLARKLGSDRAVSLRRFRAPAKPPQAPVNGQTAEVAGFTRHERSPACGGQRAHTAAPSAARAGSSGAVRAGDRRQADARRRVPRSGLARVTAALEAQTQALAADRTAAAKAPLESSRLAPSPAIALSSFLRGPSGRPSFSRSCSANFARTLPIDLVIAEDGLVVLQRSQPSIAAAPRAAGV